MSDIHKIVLTDMINNMKYLLSGASVDEQITQTWKNLIAHIENCIEHDDWKEARLSAEWLWRLSPPPPASRLARYDSEFRMTIYSESYLIKKQVRLIIFRDINRSF